MISQVAKRLLRSLGLDVRRYSSSDGAKLRRLLDTYSVDCVFDVGANSGQYARELRSLGYKHQIVSFEPLVNAHTQLLANSRRDPRWIVAPAMALAEYVGEAKIHVSENLVSSSLLDMNKTHQELAPASRYVETQAIRVQTLDSVFPEFGAAAIHPFLKIDTQGSEMQVLNGAAACLDRFIGVQAELSLTELYVGQELLLDLALRLREEGFHLVGLSPGFTDIGTGRLLQVDGVFFR